MAETKINGLTTPALNEGKVADAASEADQQKPEKSILDMAAGIELKLKALADQLEKDDREIDLKLDALAKRLQKISDTK